MVIVMNILLNVVLFILLFCIGSYGILMAFAHKRFVLLRTVLAMMGAVLVLYSFNFVIHPEELKFDFHLLQQVEEGMNFYRLNG